jgi:hypothetical protein
VKLVAGAVDLSQKALQIDCPAGPGPGDDESHKKLSVSVPVEGIFGWERPLIRWGVGANTGSRKMVPPWH